MRTAPCLYLILQATVSAFGTKYPTRPAFGLKASTEASVSTNLEVLSDRGREAVQKLIDFDQDGSQEHVYGGWPDVGTQDDDKRRLGEQVG